MNVLRHTTAAIIFFFFDLIEMNTIRSRSSSQLNMGTNSTHRSSPVSSCCGSSQGRSSPDVDFDGEPIGEPPQMPLSPG